MSVIATDSNRFSGVVKHEYEPASGFCREAVVFNDSAVTLKVGHVLGKTLTGATAAAVAGGSNTGNGTMGTVTVSGLAENGVYTLRIIKAATNAGDFIIVGPSGRVVSYGTVAVAHSAAGLAFTLADGATDFAVGDTFTITVSGGVYKYKVVEATATDGTQNAAAIFIGDKVGNSGDLAVSGSTDTTILVLARGPAKVSKDKLTFGASVNTDAEKSLAYAQFAALGVMVDTTV